MAAALRYRDHFPELVTWMSRNGLTGEEIAAELGVSRKTLYVWRERYPEFAAAMDDGRDIADARVQDALYKRAVGIQARIKTFDKKGEVVEIDVWEKPDTTACIFWLKNRRRSDWRDTWHHELTGKDGGPIEVSDADHREAEDILAAQILEEAERIARESSEG